MVWEDGGREAPSYPIAYTPPAMAKKTQSAPKSFEDGMRELEAILSEMEGGQIGL